MMVGSLLSVAGQWLRVVRLAASVLRLKELEAKLLGMGERRAGAGSPAFAVVFVV